ncbi:MAG: hypothetical protein IH613_13245 [Desulfuromonadales bacterium]|nr:hypothetical protein [Desulfuromonadales bacterium]
MKNFLRLVQKLPRRIEEYLSEAILPKGCSVNDIIWRTNHWGSVKNKPAVFSFLRSNVKPRLDDSTYNSDDLIPTHWRAILQVMVLWLVRAKNLRAGRIGCVLSAVRGFLEFLFDRYGCNFYPVKISTKDFYDYHDVLKNKTKSGALTSPGARQIATSLETFAKFLNHFAVPKKEISFRQKFPRPTSTHEYIVGSDKKRTAENQMLHHSKLLPDDVVFAIGNLYALVKIPAEKFLLSLCVLLFVTGFRIQELLSLQEDCFREFEHNGEMVGEIIYYPQKHGKPLPKPITASALPYVKEAFQNIYEFTLRGRSTAKRIADEGSIIPMEHKFRKQEFVTVAELNQELGLSKSKITARLKEAGLTEKPVKSGKTPFYSSEAAIEALDNFYLSPKTARTVGYEPIVRVLANGKEIHLDEALIVTLTYETSLERPPLRFLPTKLSEVTFARFLVDVFVRYEVRGPTGDIIRINPHQARHFLETMFKKGGLTDEETQRIFGRKNIKQNRAYNHMSGRERRESVARDVREGWGYGPIADTYAEIKTRSIDDAEEFLEAAVEAVHVTEFGACVLDFARRPCPHHLVCFTGRDGKSCRYLVVRVGDKAGLDEVEKMIDLTRRTLSAAKKSKGTYSREWVDHNEVILDNLNAVKDCHLDAIKNGRTGQAVFVFPKGASPEAIAEMKEIEDRRKLDGKA